MTVVPPASAGKINRTQSWPLWLSPIWAQTVAILTAIITAMIVFLIQDSITKKYSEVKLARELKAEYFSNAENIGIQGTLQACTPVYYGGSYNFVQVDKYLNFFDDIGFYYNENLMSESVISQYFGSLIGIVADNNEIKRYIGEYRTNNSDAQVFTHFSSLRKMVTSDPRMSKISQKINAKCTSVGTAANEDKKISKANNGLSK